MACFLQTYIDNPVEPLRWGFYENSGQSKANEQFSRKAPLYFVVKTIYKCI